MTVTGLVLLAAEVAAVIIVAAEIRVLRRVLQLPGETAERVAANQTFGNVIWHPSMGFPGGSSSA